MSNWIRTHSPQEDRGKERLQRDTGRVTQPLALQFLVLGPMSEDTLSILGLYKIPYLWRNFSFLLAIWHFESPVIVWESSPTL